jgi:hypothetical protein
VRRTKGLKSSPVDAEIYVTNADGTGIRRKGVIPVTTQRSPAPGHRSNIRIGLAALIGIYVMNADRTGVTRLTHNQVEEGSPAWQPVACS